EIAELGAVKRQDHRVVVRAAVAASEIDGGGAVVVQSADSDLLSSTVQVGSRSESQELIARASAIDVGYRVEIAAGGPGGLNGNDRVGKDLPLEGRAPEMSVGIHDVGVHGADANPSEGLADSAAGKGTEVVQSDRN